ncbi:hypothetical protein [Tateyamaria sp.]|uniref:hypothetical protein n=1 Tax=Tateyamaria sp. TaxID=1929288 RepID=UPI003B210CF8
MMNKRKNRLGQRPNVQNEVDTFRVSKPGPKRLNQIDRRVPDYINVDDELVSIGARLSGGEIEVDIPTGDYTYRGLAFLLEGKSSTSIASADVGSAAISANSLMMKAEDGKFYVKNRHFARFISRIKLEADGITVWDFEDMDRFTAYLRMFGWDFDLDDPACFVGFGWPNVFREGAAVADAYALGTANVTDLRLTVYTKLWKDGMKLRMPAWYNPVRLPAGQVISRQVWKSAFVSAGKHVINDIRIDRRIWRILVTTNSGKKIKSAEVSVGDVEWYNARGVVSEIESLLFKPVNGVLNNTGPYRHTNGDLLSAKVGGAIDLKVDMMREGLAIAPLTSDAQRRRDDRIEIELDLESANTEVTVEVFFADRL